MNIIADHGNPGKYGDSGTRGKPATPKPKSDFLIVDGWGAFGTSQTRPKEGEYPLFITVQPWEESDKTGELGNKGYSCFTSVLKEFSQSLHSYTRNLKDERIDLGFFKRSHAKRYYKENGKIARERVVRKQRGVISRTATRSINRAALSSKYGLFEGQHKLAVTNGSDMVGMLNHFESSLQRKTKENSAVVRQRYTKPSDTERERESPYTFTSHFRVRPLLEQTPASFSTTPVEHGGVSAIVKELSEYRWYLLSKLHKTLNRDLYS